MNSSSRAQVAVLIGRFQPFHNGHATLLRHALDSAPRVMVVLGSSFQARSPKNPFSWQERAAMVAATLDGNDRDRVSYIPMRDYYDDRRWANAVRRQVERHVDATAQVILVGHFKDASSDYLNRFPHWRLTAVDNELDIDATTIRRILFEAENIDGSLEVIAQRVPSAVRQYLKAWSVLPTYSQLAQEHAQVAAYQAAWRTAPYPPIFSTADAVVKTAGHVLLIRRGGFPGQGLWAVPGGFVEQRERLLQGAIRELNEETGLAVLPSSLEDALVDVKVFDHPDRSLRGRTITHAHFFDLRTEHLPEVEGSDDAAQASWVPITQLTEMEECFFEDHFHILDHFLQLTAEDARI